MKIYFLAFLCFFSSNLRAQSDSANLFQSNYNIDSLKTIYGKHKSLMKEYEAASLIALSYYPELINEYIRFKFSSINSTGRTTITFGSVFKKIDKQFIIYINDDIERTGILLNQAPFDAQIALLAHELSHVIDLKNKGFFGLLGWGISYTVLKHQAKIEKLADITTIRHGLGWQLYHWTDFVLNHSTANKHYLKMKESKYLLPDEILRYMKKNSLQY